MIHELIKSKKQLDNIYKEKKKYLQVDTEYPEEYPCLMISIEVPSYDCKNWFDNEFVYIGEFEDEE